jgi:hypothetical protein
MENDTKIYFLKYLLSEYKESMFLNDEEYNRQLSIDIIRHDGYERFDLNLNDGEILGIIEVLKKTILEYNI